MQTANHMFYFKSGQNPSG